MIRILSIIVLLISSLSMHGQLLNNEIETTYKTALSHIKNKNNAAAIKHLSRIIKYENDYKDALLLRAQSKYNMTAYKSARLDVIEHINHHGINEKAVTLLANIDHRIGNERAALATHITLSKMIRCSNDNETKKSIISERIGDYYNNSGMQQKACENWSTALIFGSKTVSDKINQYCQNVELPTKKEEVTKNKRTKSKEPAPSTKKKTILDEMKDKDKLPKEDPDSQKAKEVDEKDQKKKIDTKKAQKVEVDRDYDLGPEANNKPSRTRQKKRVNIEDDGTVNTIEIDDELTIELLKGGLGKRLIKKQPNILILSEKDGTVAVDICIDNKGIVTSASYNKQYSTLDTRHLISLAIRKSKEFQFVPSTNEEQCGIMIFNIKAL